MKKIKTIAIVTPGGDASGMNTAIRAVVRTAIYYGIKVYGIYKGWKGLIEGEIRELNPSSVSGIINRGGTILHTARGSGFRDKEIRKKAYTQLAQRNIDALVIIGGDGSLKAGININKETGMPIVHIPASIDNDISYTDYTIGFDTAVNSALEAIDKIRDTATSHERIFVIEVMGRDSGSIALDVGLASGAEAIIIPEVKHSIYNICKRIKEGQARGKESFIIVVAEGAASANDVAAEIKKCIKEIDVRVSILGHILRGGAPSAFSREIACKLGYRAVKNLIEGKVNVMLGVISDQVIETPINKVIKKKKKLDLKQYKLAEILST